MSRARPRKKKAGGESQDSGLAGLTDALEAALNASDEVPTTHALVENCIIVATSDTESDVSAL